MIKITSAAIGNSKDPSSVATIHLESDILELSAELTTDNLANLLETGLKRLISKTSANQSTKELAAVMINALQADNNLD